MTTKQLSILATLLVAVPGVAATTAGGDTGLAAAFVPYETIRDSLAGDSVDAVAAAAATLRTELEALARDFSAEGAGVPAEKAAEVEALLPEAVAAARQLEGASDLEAAREAFYALSKLLVRWRQAAGKGPDVVYCSMEKRSWLQRPGESVGNPYAGRSMASCGEVVSR